ncbi:MAG: hypothetical protein ACRDRO_00825 [Pseudonocardiaceae bacterium]
MIAQPAPAEAPDFDTPVDTGLDDRCVAELVTRTLCGLHRLDGHFVRMNATLGDDGYVAVDVTRVYFNGQDTTMRVLLHLATPVPVTPQSRAQIDHGPSAA